MTGRGGRWGGTPRRGVEPAPHRGDPADNPGSGGPADPTGGRHAFDQDAALTPIFTTLRRGGWRRPRPSAPAPFPGHRPSSAPRPLRPVPDSVARFRDDPLTAPLPVVHDDPVPDGLGTGGYAVGPIDPYDPASFAPPAPVGPPAPADATTWWSPLADPHDPDGDRLGSARRAAFDLPARAPHLHAVPSPTRYDQAYGGAYADAGHQDPMYGDPAFGDPTYGDPTYGVPAFVDAEFDDPGYGAPTPDPAYDPLPPYDVLRYDDRRYEDSRYDVHRYDVPPYADSGYEDSRYDVPGYDVPRYDVPRRPRRFGDPMSYDPVTDSGRHHRRLAPAGW